MGQARDIYDFSGGTKLRKNTKNIVEARQHVRGGERKYNRNQQPHANAHGGGRGGHENFL